MTPTQSFSRGSQPEHKPQRNLTHRKKGYIATMVSELDPVIQMIIDEQIESNIANKS